MSCPTSQLEQIHILNQAIQQQSDIDIKLADSQWTAKFSGLSDQSLQVRHNIPLKLLGKKQAVECSWQLDGHNFLFTSQISEPGSQLLTIKQPTTILKALNRNFDRIKPPDNLQIACAIAGQR